MKIKLSAIVTGILLMAGTSVLAGSYAKKDIVDTAVGAGSFNTLVAAVKAADLVETALGFEVKENNIHAITPNAQCFILS